MTQRPESTGPVNPVLAEMRATSFGALTEFRARATRLPERVVNLDVGDPGAWVPAHIRSALVARLEATPSTYPVAAGLPELRTAVADWYRRRFAVTLDPATEILPSFGSKEAIGTFEFVVCGGDRDTVVVTEPGYATPDRGARFAGARVEALPLRAEHGWLPDLDAVPASVWDRTAVFWVNYPNNPTGATAPIEFYERCAALAERHGFWLASDEPYTELWWNEPARSAIEIADRSRLVVFNSLSKRSGLTGYRSGCIVAPPPLADAVRSFRATFGLAPTEFVQHAAIAAWSDETHVEELRAVLGARHRRFGALLDAAGIEWWGRDATPYLWARVPDGVTAADGASRSEAFALALLERGVAVSPGNWFGPGGEGWFRIAAVASDDDTEFAATVLAEALG